MHSNNKLTHTNITMTTIEELTQRIALLEEQVIAITKSDNTDSKKTSKKDSSKKDSSKKDSPKKERVKSTTGYLMYSNAHRDQVKEILTSQLVDDKKVKNTDIMKELARMWKEADDETKTDWNTKAKELNAQYKSDAVSVVAA